MLRRVSASLQSSLRRSSPSRLRARGPRALLSEQNARAHVGMLAGTIGSRAVGTAANAARPRLHRRSAEAVRVRGARPGNGRAAAASSGRTARVANIIAHRCPGQRPEAIGLVAHYDSRAEAPGATDDGAGRGGGAGGGAGVRGAADRQWSLFVLAHRRRRSGLMGAAALGDRSRRHRTGCGLHAGRSRSGRAVRRCCSRPDRATRWLVVAVGAPRAASARRLVRARDLQAAAERHRLLDHQAAGHSRPELRAGRRQLRVSHARATRRSGCRRARSATPARTSSRSSTRSTATDITQRSTQTAHLLRHRRDGRRRRTGRCRLASCRSRRWCSASSPGCASRRRRFGSPGCCAGC